MKFSCKQISYMPLNPVGASLLAIAGCQSTSMLNIQPPSRASSLPQWIWVMAQVRVAPRALAAN
ncbi:hypothetical protein C9I50_22435 [Pseudomonas prosekii]|nr:hypothetical protein C9I50_22435 [Pseudomonas prosekii]